MVIWEGNSPLDGQPIVVIATGLKRPSKNEKTGKMVQIYILRQDIDPVSAIKANEDKSICGRCELRPKKGENIGKCYVNVGQGPLAAWKAYSKGSYPAYNLESFRGKIVRFGAYGDPACIPEDIVRDIVSVCKGHTGYTHQWFVRGMDWTKEFFQASCSNDNMANMAKRQGFHIFGVNLSDTFAARPCDYYTDGKTCDSCLKCNGKYDIKVSAHGNAPTMMRWEK